MIGVAVPAFVAITLTFWAIALGTFVKQATQGELAIFAEKGVTAVEFST